MPNQTLAAMYRESELDSLIYLFFCLVQSEADQEITARMAWKNDAQALAVKIFRHIASVKHLSYGLKFEFENKPHFEFIDHSTISVVTRAAFESYLAFNYIYINSEESLSVFRHKTWQLAGLIDRSQLLANTAEGKEIQAKEAFDIEELKRELSESPYFQNEKREIQNRLLVGRWRPKNGWGEMAEHAGFHRAYFDNIYNHISGHSHASFISAIQTRDARAVHVQQDMANAMKQLCCVIMAHFCFAYVRLFPAANEILNENEDVYEIAYKWRIGVEEMNRVYGVR